MKYKVGDKVRIKKDLVVDKRYGEYSFFKGVADFRGMESKITRVTDDSYVLNLSSWIFWTDEMLEDIVEKFPVGSTVKIIKGGEIYKVLENDCYAMNPYELDDPGDFLFKQNELELVESTDVIIETLVEQSELDKYKELTLLLLKEIKLLDRNKHDDILHFITELRPDLSKLAI